MKPIKVGKLKNIRDIGGVYNDITIREGVFIRGRTLLKIKRKEKDILYKDLHIRTLIDLRDPKEREVEPNEVIEGIKYVPMSFFDKSRLGISVEDQETKSKYELLKMLPSMEKIYYEMIHGKSMENLAEILHFIVNTSDEDYAIYYHCSEGKDRTGILSAIILMILGVSRKEIVEEYLYTNKVALKRANKFYFLARYVKWDKPLADRVHGLFSVKEDYIQVLFNTIDVEYGGEENFFTKGLKLTKEEIESFRLRMIIK